MAGADDAILEAARQTSLCCHLSLVAIASSSEAFLSRCGPTLSSSIDNVRVERFTSQVTKRSKPVESYKKLRRRSLYLENTMRKRLVTGTEKIPVRALGRLV
jgi:hypothetical protein